MATKQRDGETQAMTLRMSPALHRAAARRAEEADVTKTAWLVSVIAGELGIPGHELPEQKTT
ncbi:toxin-antitoxin system HicB family antitoxin [Rothia uropygialis]|uniref:toxin-antitoxin system HicB family antitoxin n=1 Tax=Kocuria sp. 36 TaxID=1415402 RepID=UPI00101CDA89|nr:toxin-antitoxin system HicB family antitoxin [Kocuria sp. 36]